MREQKQLYTRRFLGEIDTSTMSNPEEVKKRRFHNAHLKAYLKGQEKFHFGRDEENKYMWYDVMAKLYKVKND